MSDRPFEDSPHDGRCKARSKQTQLRCRQAVLEDQKVCRFHGGASPQARRKATERAVERKIRGLLTSTDAPAVTDPVAELMRLGGEVVRWKDVLAEIVDTMGETLRYQGITGEQLRAEVAVFERAMDRCGSLLATMARLNLAERQVRIDEAKAELLIRLVASAMRQVNVPPQTQADIWGVLKKLIAEERSRDPLVVVSVGVSEDIGDSLGMPDEASAGSWDAGSSELGANSPKRQALGA